MSAAEAAAAAARAQGAPVFIRALTPSEVAGFSTGAGPLDGLPFAMKDNLDLRGMPTTGGCPALVAPAGTTAAAAQRLIDAGAVPIAKTNLDQFATGLVGTRSPYGVCASIDSPLHVSGGSSSGSAVAVASGVVPLALGTDTAGSGRVPAAFNGLVGVKPTRGLVSTAGLMPACRSLDCVTTLTRTVSDAREAMAVLTAFDPGDPWSRPAPVLAPAGVAAFAGVVAVPRTPLDLDPVHRAAWEAAVEHVRTVADHVVEVDIEPFLAAGRLLYEGPWLAERWAAFGHLLEPDGPHLDPVVRQVVLPGRDLLAADLFAGIDRLASLRRASEPTWDDVDALLLPVSAGHPTLADVAADPIGANLRLGTYTSFVNLLDLCAVAVPAGRRTDGLPFGVQLVAPAFADGPLLELAARWCGEPSSSVAAGEGRTLLAVVGAHLSGLALNSQLVDSGGRLHRRARTAGGYRLFALPGDGVARPGLLRSSGGPAGGIALEVWDLPHQGVGMLADLIPRPLGLGTVELADGSGVLGFLAEGAGLRDAADISGSGGWRAYLQGRETQA